MPLDERNIGPNGVFVIPRVADLAGATPIDAQAAFSSGLDFGNKLQDQFAVKPLERAAKQAQLADSIDASKSNMVLRPLTTKRDAQAVNGAISLFPKQQAVEGAKLDAASAGLEDQALLRPVLRRKALADASTGATLAEGQASDVATLSETEKTNREIAKRKSDAALFEAEQLESDPYGNKAAIIAHLNSAAVPFDANEDPASLARKWTDYVRSVQDAEIRKVVAEKRMTVVPALESEHRKEFEANPGTKTFRGVQEARTTAQSVLASVPKGEDLTGTQAQELKFALLKAFNPEAKRENVAQAEKLIANAQSLSDQAKGRIKAWLTGSSIDQSVAAQMMDTIESRYQQELVGHKRRADAQAVLSKGYGLDPSNIVIPNSDDEANFLRGSKAPASPINPSGIPRGSKAMNFKHADGSSSTGWQAPDGSYYSADGVPIPSAAR